MSETIFTEEYLRENFIRLNNVELGRDVKIFSFVNAYGCRIGDGSKIGAFVEIQKNAEIGKNCKVSSHTFICEGVRVEDNVFIGHGVMFTNDKYPRATNADGSQQTEALSLAAQHFIDCIKNDKKPITDGTSGLNVVRILEASEASIKNQGKLITLS